MIKLYLALCLFLAAANVEANGHFILPNLEGESCKTESVPNLNGLCTGSKSNCHNRGGRVSGKCSTFYYCCVFESHCGQTSHENPAYFQNEQYPASEFGNGACEFNYDYGNSCYVRMHISDMRLAGVDESGKCFEDYLIILNGNVDMIEPICGDKTGEDLFIRVFPENGPLKVLVARNSQQTTEWNIEFSKIPCSKSGIHIGEADKVITEFIQNLQDKILNGEPDAGIEPLDPYPIDYLPIDIDKNGTRIKGELTNVVIKDFGNFTIEKVFTDVALNLQHASCHVILNVPNTNIQGKYNWDGIVSNIVPLYGNGSISIDVKQLKLDFYSYIAITDMLLQNLTFNFHVDETQVEIDGIEGGGDMENFVNGVLSSLGPDLLNAFFDKQLPILTDNITDFINSGLHPDPLKRLSTLPNRDAAVNEFFDILFANIRQEIRNKDLDPIALPGDQDTFSCELFNTNLTGTVYIQDGKLGGISTIRRDGNMTLQYDGADDGAVVGGNVGFSDLEIKYSMGLNLGLFHDKYTFTIKLSYASLFLIVEEELHPSNLVIKECGLTHFNINHIKIQGAGLVDTPLYNLILNGIIKPLQPVIQDDAGAIICDFLLNQLSPALI